MQDVMGGQVPMMVLDLASGLSAVQSGKVKPIAIGSPQRSAVLPDVPTLAELGVKDAEVFAVQGVVGPAGIPAPVVARLNQELNKALAEPSVLNRFTGFGFEPLRMSPEQFRAMARSEARRWGPVIRQANVTLD
jgi:tripartite-type tricarboxylate transporter receptor subunit TctC